MNLVSWLILLGVIIIVGTIKIIVIAKQYRKVGPNEVLIIAGGRKRDIVQPDGTRLKVGYRYRLGGGEKSLGTTKITAQVAEILAQMPEVFKSLSGVDLKKFLKDKLSPEEKD